jgi:cysteine-rich repeat protein
MKRIRSWGLRGAGVGLTIAFAASACGGDDDDTSGGGAKAGKAGSAGSAQAGNGGRSSSGGKAGSASVAGAGSGGTAGAATGGTAGSGGDTAGRSATGGAGTGGTDGAGTSGTGGTSGTSGTSGTGGTGGDGSGGAGSSAGGASGQGGESGQGGDGGDGGETVGASGASGEGGAPTVVPVCGNTAVEAGEECDGGNTADLDGCNSKCQSEVSSGPGLGLSIADNGYDGTLTSMRCINLAVGSKADGLVDSVKVLLALNHTFVGDLVLKLVSPSNTVVTLMSRPGVAEPTDDGVSSGGDSSNVAVGFPLSFVDGGPKSAEDMGNTLPNADVVCEDDAACVYAPAAGAATAGTLAAFVGQAAVGTWRVCVGDGLTGDAGSIDFVRLSVVQ